MRCEEIRELLPLHALDILEEREAAEVRAHLAAGCPRCSAEIAAARETLAQLPYSLPAQEPSSMAKARLMAAVHGEGAGARAADNPAFWGKAATLAAAASLVAALLTGVLVGRRYAAQSEELRAQIRIQKEELARLEGQFRRTRDTILLVRSPGSKVIDLQGQEERAAAAARVFWDVRRGTWRLYADNLPAAGPGRTYQLWLVTAKAKISAGVFDPGAEEGASGTVSVPPEAGTVVAAAVTPEPEGGSSQPTGSILLLGKI